VSEKIRVLVADDHPVVREGLVSLIDRQPDMQVVGEAGTGREALESHRSHHPDVTMMDLRMPEMTGIDAIVAIRREEPEARIVCLTTFDGDEDIYRALHAGARGYLLKGFSRELLLECIRTVYRGEMWIPPAVAGKLATRVGRPELSTREMDVLGHLVRGRANKEIATSLNITEGTVKVHVNHIFIKLGVNGRTEAISEALKRGIVNLPE